MKRFFEIMKYEFKILIRNKLNYIIFPLIIFFLYHSVKNGITDLTLSGYVVQVLILGSMLLGYQSSIREKKEGSYELLSVIGEKYITLPAKLCANYIFITLLNLFLILFMLAFGIRFNSPHWIMVEAVLYLTLYYFLNSLISVTLGFIIGCITTEKIGYALVIVLSVIIGVLGRGFFDVLTSIINIGDFRSVISMLNLGQYDVREGFNYLYGFEIETKRFLHHLTYWMIALLVLNLLWLVKIKKSKRTFLRFTIIFFIPTIILGIFYQVPRFEYKPGRAESDAKSLYDRVYYGKKEFIYEKSPYKIEKINVIVDTTKLLKVDGDFEILFIEDTDVVEGTLYRDLKIKEVKLGDKSLSFNQDGDLFTIYIEEQKYKNDKLTLHIRYEGISSQHFYAGQKAVLLPSYFSWMIYPGKTDVMFVDNSILQTTPLFPENEIEYIIKYIGGNNIFTNLEKEKDIYHGISKEGLTMISGELKHKKEGNKDYYYTFNIRESQMIPYTNKLSSHIKKIEDILEKSHVPIERVFYVPIKFELIGNTCVETMKTGSTLISGSYPSLRSSEEVFFNEAFGSILNTDINFIKQDKEIRKIFIELFSTWYLKESGIAPELKRNRTEVDSVFLDFIDKAEKKEIKSFFKFWYQEMKEKEKLTMEDIEEILLSVQ